MADHALPPHSGIPCDLSLRLKGSSCLPNFAGWYGYSSIAAFLIDPRIDAMGQEETL
ncbi:MAG TPA: hypothetical protein VGI36_08910 [Candidatus Binataceae bacterium]|jgi:hypothetical protein